MPLAITTQSDSDHWWRAWDEDTTRHKFDKFLYTMTFQSVFSNWVTFQLLLWHLLKAVDIWWGFLPLDHRRHGINLKLYCSNRLEVYQLYQPTWHWVPSNCQSKLSRKTFSSLSSCLCLCHQHNHQNHHNQNHHHHTSLLPVLKLHDHQSHHHHLYFSSVLKLLRAFICCWGLRGSRW